MPARRPPQTGPRTAALLFAGLVLTGCAGAATGAAIPAGVPAADTVVSVDWKAAAYGPAGCPSRGEWVAGGGSGGSWDAKAVSTGRGDVTGDGTPEVLVQLTCPSAVSAPADAVVVFDVSRGEPDPLGVLGDAARLQGATVTTEGPAVTLSGPAVADDDPTCCPGHWASVTYWWTGAGFQVAEQVEVRTTQPVTSGGLADGEHVGLVRAVAADRVYVDLLEWFEGPAAAAACREDGIPEDGTERCSIYYVRDVDDRVSVLPVQPGAPVSYLDLWTAEEIRVGSVAALAGTRAVSADGGHGAYMRFAVEDGEVTSLEEIFVP